MSARTSTRTFFLTLGASLGLALALPATSATAQQPERSRTFDLVGTVTGEAGQPLVGAFVWLDGSDWGSLTDEAGRFRIPDMDPGRTALLVQQLGYDTLRWEGVVSAAQPLELRMTPRPVLLEGLHVVTDRFESRRRAVPTAVQAFDRRALVTTPQQTVRDFIRSRAAVTLVPCHGAFSSTCLLVRGRVSEPVVYVDEAPFLGGMDYLEVMRPDELYMIEIYGRGRQIRAYTNRFMARAAKIRLQPVAFLY
jgi:hypothetical protein